MAGRGGACLTYEHDGGLGAVLVELRQPLGGDVLETGAVVESEADDEHVGLRRKRRRG